MPEEKKDPKLKEKCRIQTPVFRVGFPHLFKPQAIKGNTKLTFSVQMLFPKETDLTIVKEAMRNAKLLKFGPKENWPKKFVSPVVDGDDPEFAKTREGYKGCWVIKASAQEDQKPVVLGSEKDEEGKYVRITNPGDFYPGCYARAIIFAFGWDNVGGKGVSFGLDHIQKVKDGKQFGGRKSPEESFSPIGPGDESEDAEDDEDNGSF